MTCAIVLFAGLQVAVIAMASSAWEVRNAASLIFTALVIRMLGFRNLVKVHNYPPSSPPIIPLPPSLPKLSPRRPFMNLCMHLHFFTNQV